MLPIILQHVRELAEVHVAAPERDRYKIITPFPPAGQDFPEFQDDDLAFRDLPPDAPTASLDSLHAYEFFKRTDSLYYDYSYGIRSEEFALSRICERFFGSAVPSGGDVAFDAPFGEQKSAFTRLKRVTSGDLGNLPFRYTSLSPVSWNRDRVVLGSTEIERLKQKALAVYEDLEPGTVGFLNALIEEVKAANFASIEYDFGFFDVIREWMDPRLFESTDWSFPWGNRTLYGEGDSTFANNAVKLCYAQRYYVVRSYTGTVRTTPPPEPPEVRDHGMRRLVVDRGRLHRLGAVAVREAPAATEVIEAPVDLHRRALRNVLIHRKAIALGAPAVVAPVAPRAGFVWVPATASVPGHWERARAGAPAPVPDPPAPKAGYTVAALKCRLVAPTP